MKISIVSLFPEFFTSPLSTALLGKAVERGILSVSLYNPRNYATDARRNVDDIPYGGGVGMVMALPQIASCIDAIEKKGKILLLSPSGKPFTQKDALRFSKEEALTVVCGRYEGIDARISEIYDVEEISVGDFILNGGESGALLLLESIGRLLPSFMGTCESTVEESFVDDLLEYPQYTRPAQFRGASVPPVLLSGNHKEIARFRRKKQLEKTLHNRKDMLQKTLLKKEDRAYLKDIEYTRCNKNIYIALVHHPVLGKNKKNIAVSLTNLDIHDIARCTCTYGLGGYYITTPLKEQQRLCATIVSHWLSGHGSEYNPARAKAMERVHCVDSIEDAVQGIEKSTGSRPYIIATSASAVPTCAYSDVQSMAQEQAVLLLFGTSHGLAPEVYSMVQGVLPPIRYIGGYNHLSVRSAVAITIDRILGDYF